MEEQKKKRGRPKKTMESAPSSSNILNQLVESIESGVKEFAPQEKKFPPSDDQIKQEATETNREVKYPADWVNMSKTDKLKWLTANKR